MLIDNQTRDQLEAFIDFFADCRKKNFAKEAPEQARRFLVLDRELAALQRRPAIMDVCGWRIALDPPPEKTHYPYPAQLELDGILEEIDDETLENRVDVNLRSSVAELYLSLAEAESPDRDFLSYIEGYLDFAVCRFLAWTIAFEDLDDACCPPQALLRCLRGCALKSGSAGAKAYFALAVFSQCVSDYCPAEYAKEAADMLETDVGVCSLFMDETDEIADDRIRNRVLKAAAAVHASLMLNRQNT